MNITKEVSLKEFLALPRNKIERIMIRDQSNFRIDFQ